MTSEKKNEIGADDSNGRVRKIRKADALALKESDQLRLAHRCVLHIRGVGRITTPDSIFFARENHCPSHAQSDRKDHRQMNHQPQPNSMKSTLCSLSLKITSLIVLLIFYFGSSTYGQARDRDVLSPRPVRPGNLDYRTELPQGYLKVYSESDEFNDGAYYAHSSYAIYSIDGRLFKRVENNISRTDEIIPWEVALPAGSYSVVARSARDGEIRVHFVIKAGRRAIVDLDLAEKETYRQRLQTSDRVAS